MISVFIPHTENFKKYESELRNLYNKNQNKICDSNSFEFIKNNTLFYAFVEDNKLIGAIYYFKDQNKLFLNGYSNRKCFEANLKCLRLSTTWFNCSIYAEAQNRASALCLLRVGFKRYKNNIFYLKR